MVIPAMQSDDYNPNHSSGNPASRQMVLVIPPECAGMRLDQALARLLPNLSRSRLQSWMREGMIRVGSSPALPKTKVWGGEKIAIDVPPDPGETAHAPEAIPLRILYEDDAILVIDKPAGLVVHPGSGNWQGTMLNALLNHAPELSSVPRAGIVHRLDKETSGLLVVAKTLESQTSLVRQLQRRTVKREYLAIVHGWPPQEGVVEAPVGRHPTARTKMAVVSGGKAAVTRYSVLEQLPGCALLRCTLETGRTHQIRVHMHSIGHPLVGDPVYGSHPRSCPAPVRETLAGFPRQALHAERLALIHPTTGKEISWESPPPTDITELLTTLRTSLRSDRQAESRKSL